MFWYFREEKWGYQHLYGPFDSLIEAARYKKSIQKSGYTYAFFISDELLQPV